MALPEGGINLEDLEKDLILQALKKYAGNQTRAAQYLNMSRRALAYRLEKYDFHPESAQSPQARRVNVPAAMCDFKTSPVTSPRICFRLWCPLIRPFIHILVVSGTLNARSRTKLFTRQCTCQQKCAFP